MIAPGDDESASFMRERAIEEFESIFEQASIPVLDIEEIELKRISAVLTGTELDESVVRIAEYLRSRFGADVVVHRAPNAGTACGANLGSSEPPFNTTAELVGQLSIARSQLVLVPLADGGGRHSVDIDSLVQGSRPPILMIRQPVGDPASIFDHVLHALTGSFQQTQNFSYSFTLVGERGTLKLLHAIDARDLDAVREALRVSPNIEAGDERELLESMAHRGERYLQAVVAASRGSSYDVTYRLAVSDVQATVRSELQSGTYGLLVVGQHRDGHSHIDAADYQLMHSIEQVPILAL